MEKGRRKSSRIGGSGVIGVCPTFAINDVTASAKQTLKKTDTYRYTHIDPYRYMVMNDDEDDDCSLLSVVVVLSLTVAACDARGHLIGWDQDGAKMAVHDTDHDGAVGATSNNIR